MFEDMSEVTFLEDHPARRDGAASAEESARRINAWAEAQERLVITTHRRLGDARMTVLARKLVEALPGAARLELKIAFDQWGTGLLVTAVLDGRGEALGPGDLEFAQTLLDVDGARHYMRRFATTGVDLVAMAAWEPEERPEAEARAA